MTEFTLNYFFKDPLSSKTVRFWGTGGLDFNTFILSGHSSAPVSLLSSHRFICHLGLLFCASCCYSSSIYLRSCLIFWLVVCVCVCVCVLVPQSCPTLCNPMDYSLPDSSVHGILQARIPEWVTTLFSKGSQPRDQIWLSCITGRFFTWFWEALVIYRSCLHIGD